MAKRGYELQQLIDICKANNVLELQFGEVRLFFDEPRKEIQAIGYPIQESEEYYDQDDSQEECSKPKPLRRRKRVRRN
jgi:hypothetical protein